MLRKKEKRFICVNCLKAKGTKRKLFYRIRLFVDSQNVPLELRLPINMLFFTCRCSSETTVVPEERFVGNSSYKSSWVNVPEEHLVTNSEYLIAPFVILTSLFSLHPASPDSLVYSYWYCRLLILRRRDTSLSLNMPLMNY